MNIVKRDGRIVPFKKEKIENAVMKAFNAVGDINEEYAHTKAENIANHIEELAKLIEEPFTVEEIQDLVEKGLMSLKQCI